LANSLLELANSSGELGNSLLELANSSRELAKPFGELGNSLGKLAYSSRELGNSPVHSKAAQSVCTAVPALLDRGNPRFSKNRLALSKGFVALANDLSGHL